MMIGSKMICTFTTFLQKLLVIIGVAGILGI